MKRNATDLLDEDLSKWGMGIESFTAMSVSLNVPANTDNFFEKINRLSLELDKRLLKLEAKNQD